MRKIVVSIVVTVLLLPPLLLAGALFWPPVAPQQSVLKLDEGVKRADFSDLPRLRHFAARDTTRLAFRRYAGKAAGGIAVVVHGSSGNSAAVHSLAKALSAAGMTVYAPDVRGHGASGPRGDIRYVGQLEDDLADLVKLADRERPGEGRILVGHSSGGGFALRVAAGPARCLFGGYLALAPFLSSAAATTRPANGNWTGVAMPRIVALTFLSRSGIHGLGGLPVLAFAIPPGSGAKLTGTYSYRLMSNFGLDPVDWQASLRAIDRPTIVAVGENDELFLPHQFEPVLASLAPSIRVRLIPRADHMGLALDPLAQPDIARNARELLAKSNPPNCVGLAGSTLSATVPARTVRWVESGPSSKVWHAEGRSPRLFRAIVGAGWGRSATGSK